MANNSQSYHCLVSNYNNMCRVQEAVILQVFLSRQNLPVMENYDKTPTSVQVHPHFRDTMRAGITR